MVNFKKLVLLMVLLVFVFFSSVHAGKQQEVNKSFKGVEKVKISTVSGNCVVKQGKDGVIQVKVVYSFDSECFDPVLEQRGKKLILKERFSGNRCSGHSTWTVTVPETTDVSFSSASGDLSLNGLKADLSASNASGEFEISDCSGTLRVSTASGSINLENVSGELKASSASGKIKAVRLQGKLRLSTASGDINIKNAKGEFKVSVASGDIDASAIELTDDSSFSTASGDIEVALAKSAAYDLKVSTASGDATLDYQGNPVKGYFEFTAKKRKGKIISPFKFDKEEEFTRNGDKVYMRKSFSKGGKSPEILIRTASGKARLKK